MIFWGALNLSATPRVLSREPSRTEGDHPLRPDRQILETELLVTRCQRGDRAAFGEIVRLWERPLFYYLRRLASGEADAWDLLQETWLRVYRASGSIRDPRTLPAFLYTTARNVAVTRLRINSDESPQPANDAGANDCAFIAFDDAEQVHHALDQLPLPQREAVTLYFLQDLSIDEIAGVLDVPPGTVKSRLHYGKQAIRKIITNGDGHE
jgi:RNA polymerase sigma-70 factor (ECF subfamily)